MQTASIKTEPKTILRMCIEIHSRKLLRSMVWAPHWVIGAYDFFFSFAVTKNPFKCCRAGIGLPVQIFVAIVKFVHILWWNEWKKTKPSHAVRLNGHNLLIFSSSPHHPHTVPKYVLICRLLCLFILIHLLQHQMRFHPYIFVYFPLRWCVETTTFRPNPYAPTRRDKDIPTQSIQMENSSRDGFFHFPGFLYSVHVYAFYADRQTTNTHTHTMRSNWHSAIYCSMQIKYLLVEFISRLSTNRPNCLVSFYNFHQSFDRIDIVSPNSESQEKKICVDEWSTTQLMALIFSFSFYWMGK